MKRPEHKLEATTMQPAPQINISSLKTAEEMALALKGHITAERLIALADAGYAPHWRIDGGPPLFAPVEIRQWVAENVVQRNDGREVPLRVPILCAGPPIADPFEVPTAIRCIENLRDITETVVLPPGVYILALHGEVVYVGQSVQPASRIAQHVKDKDFDRAYFLPWPADQLTHLEGALIRALNPTLNGRAHRAGLRGDRDAAVLAGIGLGASVQGA